MRYLVTGSSGHLGEAMVRTLRARSEDFISVDILPGAFTKHVGSITDAELIERLMKGVDVVFHCATLHKPHVATHSKTDFIETNISGTQRLLEAAIASRVKAFIFTSTTSTFGLAMRPGPGEPAVWIDETVEPVPKNIYGVTKLAAENLCALAHREHGLNIIVLKTSRFFPEDDDHAGTRRAFADGNSKLNEFTFRRADITDMVSAHFCATERAEQIGFDKFIISATTPFQKSDLARLRTDAPSVLSKYFDYKPAYDAKGWQMFSGIDRVYDNSKARRELGWNPKHNFADVLARIKNGGRVLSDMAYDIGKKGYHDQDFDGDGPYPVSD